MLPFCYHSVIPVSIFIFLFKATFFAFFSDSSYEHLTVLSDRDLHLDEC